MKRCAIHLEEVASPDNLGRAFWRAAHGSPRAPELEAWRADLDAELGRLQSDLRRESLRLGQFRTFHIHDPKPRLIHAPSFRERVLHHAVMAHVGPCLDRALAFDTYACRVGKGAHAAALRAQHFARRFPWYVQIDIRSFFASIDHAVLKRWLARRVKGRGVLRLLDAIMDAHHDEPGKGLPIGALTSQHFANYYLSGLDRLLLQGLQVRGMVRYMDDVVWWCGTEREAARTLEQATAYLEQELLLRVKPTPRVRRSTSGLRLCGFHVFPGALWLSARRMRRYSAARARCEAAFTLGLVNERALQQGYAAALAITAHADATGFRREQLRRVPVRALC